MLLPRDYQYPDISKSMLYETAMSYHQLWDDFTNRVEDLKKESGAPSLFKLEWVEDDKKLHLMFLGTTREELRADQKLFWRIITCLRILR